MGHDRPMGTRGVAAAVPRCPLREGGGWWPLRGVALGGAWGGAQGAVRAILGHTGPPLVHTGP